MPYFLLVTPDTFYLWRGPKRKTLEAFAKGEKEEVQPDHVASAWEIVRPYLGVGDGWSEEVSTYAMTIVVGAFLGTSSTGTSRATWRPRRISGGSTTPDSTTRCAGARWRGVDEPLTRC